MQHNTYAREKERNEIDSAATQPKLRRMYTPWDLSEDAAECSKNVDSQCGNEAGAADSPAVPAVAENTNEIDSAATQHYAAECKQIVDSQCGNEAGAADSPDSAEHIWEAPLPESYGSSNNSGEESEDNRNYWTSWLADQFRRAALALEEGRSFTTEYVSEDDDGNELCHRRYYMESREVTKDCFELEHTGCFEVYGIGGQHRGKCNTDTAVAGV